MPPQPHAVSTLTGQVHQPRVEGTQHVFAEPPQSVFKNLQNSFPPLVAIVHFETNIVLVKQSRGNPNGLALKFMAVVMRLDVSKDCS